MFMIQLRLHVCWSVPFFRLCSTRLARMDSLQLPAAIAGATTSFPAHTLDRCLVDGSRHGLSQAATLLNTALGRLNS